MSTSAAAQRQAQPRRFAIAIGDPNGIGPEIALKAAMAQMTSGAGLGCVLVGDGHVLERTREALGIGAKLVAYRSAGEGDIAIEAVDALDPLYFAPGTMSPEAGRATIAYATRAVALAMAGTVDAVVGCPQSETAINNAGIAFSGYPPLIADLTGTPRERVFMMLAAGGLRIAHCTLHESVSTALARLTPELVIAAVRATDGALRRLGIERPTIAVCGINPHAGEDGLFGDDDERITKPAVARLKAERIDVTGPVGADLAISERRHDGYVVMFHDQGHIPIKLLSPRRASALAIGTPVLFSSVGHGCAYDIAGKGVAEPVSVIETMALLASYGREQPRG
jgi:4-hydroxy-L-threonine phosphate dehydrogenase PdxA